MSVDSSLTRDGDMLAPLGKDQRTVERLVDHFWVLVVLRKIGDAQQNGGRSEVKLHVAPQDQAAGDERAAIDRDHAAPIPGENIDGPLDWSCVVRLAVAGGAELTHIEAASVGDPHRQKRVRRSPDSRCAGRPGLIGEPNHRRVNQNDDGEGKQSRGSHGNEHSYLCGRREQSRFDQITVGVPPLGGLSILAFLPAG